MDTRSRIDPLVVADIAFGGLGTRTGEYALSEDLHWIETGAGSLLAHAVMNNDDAGGFEEALARHGFLGWLNRHVDQGERVMGMIEDRHYPYSVAPGPYHCLAFANAAWALGERAIGDQEIAFTRRKAPSDLSTKFWRDYARAMQALVDGIPYSPAPLKYASFERYWAVYLDVVADITHQRDPRDSVEAAHVAFVKRNKDRRLGRDGSGFEGSGYDPVGFDFRLAGILRRANSSIDH